MSPLTPEQLRPQMDTLSQVAAMPSAGTLPIIDADALRSLRESLAELHAHPDLAQRARVRVMYRQAIGSVRSHIDLVQRGTLPCIMMYCTAVPPPETG